MSWVQLDWEVCKRAAQWKTKVFMASEIASVGHGTSALWLNDKEVTSQRMSLKAHSKWYPLSPQLLSLSCMQELV